MIFEILTVHIKAYKSCHIHCVPLDCQLPEFYDIFKKGENQYFQMINISEVFQTSQTENET